MTQDNATVRRWQLADTLRRLREDAGLTHDQVIARLKEMGGKWSRPKLSRIENREQGIRAAEIEQLLDVYAVTDHSLRTWLTDLAGTAHERGWVFQTRKHFSSRFHLFLSWETALVARRQFETLLVPGLLQTAEYSRALISGIHPELDEATIADRVAARLARQQNLTQGTPTVMHVILDEGVLERPVGSARVMRNQLRRLAEAAEEPHITIQILPKSLGANPGLEGPFSVLSLPDPMPDVAYTEAPSLYIEDKDSVQHYTFRFGMLTRLSLSATESLTAITNAAAAHDESGGRST